MLSTLFFGSAYAYGQFQTCPRAAYAVGNIHTGAQMTVSFTSSCADVAEEVTARANMENGWQDPHNRGKYKYLSNEDNIITTTRTTGNGQYTDKQTFYLTDNGTGCNAQICSESQGTSADDGGTNICDMFDLFCNSETSNPENGVKCVSIKHNLSYTVDNEECVNWFGEFMTTHQCQNAETTCLKVQSPSMENAAMLARLGALANRS